MTAGDKDFPLGQKDASARRMRRAFARVRG